MASTRLIGITVWVLFVIGTVQPASLRCIPIFCPGDPCIHAVCLNHPFAVCKPNYCGGCVPEFYENGQRVTDCSGGTAE